MTRLSPTSLAYGTSTTDNRTLGSTLAFPLVLVTLVLVASYPVSTTAVLLAVGTLTKATQLGLAAVVRRAGDRIGRFELPGVGTVSIRISPR
ncbi:hypothetical protein EGH21_02570 [Halomicroarcula sp. F13]|uniref:Uncharacterized protein n=1 Tax=Haloarcula rubra TaxID=2487747 RepID=A0AAW4PMG9_9EURY|nr:hypothetical protein [Halomicroarcula rubra]MBX0321909.1 hypothetical protein [Halomicroarcula rubra]